MSSVWVLSSVLAGASVTPNENGLPGVAGIAVSAMVWALGSNSANPHLAGRGKHGVIAASVCALLIGGADLIVNFFQSAGASI